MSQAQRQPGSRRAVTAALTLTASLLGCGNEQPPSAGRTDSRDQAIHSATDLVRADDPRLVVATVNGIPVFGDCVERQAAAYRLDRSAALGQCVDFELLAQTALRRGLGADPEVLEVRRTEIVRALIDHEFADRIATAADLPAPLVNAAYDQNLMRFQRPEYREAIYVRAEIPKGNNDPAVEAAAKALASDIHAALADKRGLSNEEFLSIANQVAGDRPLGSGAPFNFPLRGRAVPEFADATFAIPEVGRVSVPTRTKWGWDVILLTKIFEKIDIDRAHAAELMFDHLRSREFLAWAARLSDGHELSVNAEVLAALAAEADEAPSPAGADGAERTP